MHSTIFIYCYAVFYFQITPFSKITPFFISNIDIFRFRWLTFCCIINIHYFSCCAKIITICQIIIWCLKIFWVRLLFTKGTNAFSFIKTIMTNVIVIEYENRARILVHSNLRIYAMPTLGDLRKLATWRVREYRSLSSEIDRWLL